MAKSYSYDLREKVINAIELDGLKKSEGSQLFHISRNTIDLWLKRKTQTGDFKPQPNKPPGHSHKITDWEKFREFAQTHGDKTQEQRVNSGKEISVLEPSPEPCNVLNALEKNLWV